MNSTTQGLQQFYNKHQYSITAAMESGLYIESSFWTYLQASEEQLIELMSGHPPAHDADGNLELSFCLYLLYEPDDPLLSSLKKCGMPALSVIRILPELRKRFPSARTRGRMGRWFMPTSVALQGGNR